MILKQITNMAGDHIVGEIFCIGFVFKVLHHPTGACWVLLDLSHRQYRVYDKKMSPTFRRPTKVTHLEIFAQNEKHQCKNKPISKKTRLE